MSEDWAYQLSVKVDGQHLLNLRADDAVAFKDALAWATENKEPILLACAALGATERHQPARPAATPSPAPVVSQKPAGGETGPIGIDGVTLKRGPKTFDPTTKKDVEGTPWKSPMYVVAFSDGTSASTFDELDGKAAMGLTGGPCYVRLVPG